MTVISSEEAIQQLIKNSTAIILEAGLGPVSTNLPSTMTTNSLNARSFVFNANAPVRQLSRSLAINPNVFISQGNVLA